MIPRPRFATALLRSWNSGVERVIAGGKERVQGGAKKQPLGTNPHPLIRTNAGSDIGSVTVVNFNHTLDLKPSGRLLRFGTDAARESRYI